jgi:3-oxoacyl-(acyl-carrier-protein) synthase
MPRNGVAVTGFGVISSLGRGPDENSAALRAGTSGIVSQRPAWADAKLRSQVSGKVEAEPLRGMFERKDNRFLCDSALLAAVAMAG